jgi:hypothetical protein
MKRNAVRFVLWITVLIVTVPFAWKALVTFNKYLEEAIRHG